MTLALYKLIFFLLHACIHVTYFLFNGYEFGNLNKKLLVHFKVRLNNLVNLELKKILIEP